VNREFKAIIVDDEPLARETVKEHLKRHPEIRISGECSNGFEAVKMIHELQPDLVFLDIQMPKLDGFDVIELLGKEAPQVIFITAFDEYALKAFEAQAVDYILKPVKAERFDKAVKRITGTMADNPDERIDRLIDHNRNNSKPLSRILIRDGVNVTILDPKDVIFVEASDDYVKFHTSQRYWLKSDRMSNLEQTLDTRIFCRIHRSYIININFITKIEPYSKDSRIVRLSNGKSLPVSRNGYSRLIELM
jgi:two-component system LytT family response regulator